MAVPTIDQASQDPQA